MWAVSAKLHPTRAEWHAAAVWCLEAAAEGGCGDADTTEMWTQEMYACAAKCCERAANLTY